MNARRHRWARAAALLSLEADADQARGGFACMFSTSQEYETALISARRAQGRYDRPYGARSIALLVGSAMVVAGLVMLFA
jgi:hypothetical protein